MDVRSPSSGTDDALEARTEEQIKVRQVTHFQPSWTEQGRALPGAFTIQLVLDHGADEYVLHPAAEDVGPLLALLQGGRSVYFDRERKVLMLENRELGG